MTGPKAVTEEEEEQLGSDEPKSIPGAGAARSCRRGRRPPPGPLSTLGLHVCLSYEHPAEARDDMFLPLDKKIKFFKKKNA